MINGTKVGKHMGTTASRAAVAAVAVVLVTAGCGGSGGSGGSRAGSGQGGSPKTTAPRTPDTPMAVGDLPPLTQAQLEKAVVGPKDLKGWRTGTVLGRGGDGMGITPTVIDVSRVPRISPAACQPLYAMTQTVSRQQYHAVVEQQVGPVAEGGDGPQGLMMSLRSYTGPDAAQLMADLRTSLRTCTSYADPDSGSWGSPRRLADPETGDEALSYHLLQTVPSVDRKGKEDGGTPAHGRYSFVVVRSGSTVAAYYTAGTDDDPGYPALPMDVVTAQTAKLAELANTR